MAYAARLLPRIQPSASPGAAPLSDPRRPSFLRVGALCESPTIQTKMSVANSATAFGVKQNTRPILVIDNYDSFTYDLCQYMGEVGADFEVYRNDEISVDEIKKISPRGIISPGPGTPQDSGISLQTAKELGPSIPLLGTYPVHMGSPCTYRTHELTKFIKKFEKNYTCSFHPTTKREI